MTAPAPRQSSQEPVMLSTARALLSMLLGIGIAIVGLFILVNEVQHSNTGEQVHKTHIYIAVGLIAAGSFLIVPSTVTKVFVTIVPYIPILGGRRREDPPALPPKDPQ